MPAYNAAATIGAAIESVQAQTRPDFELIVVNDGSTDDTVRRVEPYLEDARVKLISQENLGQPTARNTAIAAARGAYVSLLDSDDLWLRRYLETMEATLHSETDAAVAYTDAWVLDQPTGRIARETAMSRWHPALPPTDPPSFLRALLERGNFVFVGATIRRSTLDDVGSFRADVQGVEDFELWLRIAAHGYRFARCPVNLAIYRRRPGQVSADRERMRRVADRVFGIVVEEYDIPADARELAQRKLPLLNLPSGKPRRVPRVLERPRDAVSRLRRFYVRPPKEVREVLDKVRSL
jgi:glycosyltransferase involved in cell wall biosynthesis